MRNSIPGISIVALALIAVITLNPGCSSPPPVITHVLPENVMVHPPQTVGVITLEAQSPIYTALRALGVSWHRIPIDSLVRFDRYRLPIVIMEENLLEDERVAGAYRVFLDHIRKGTTLLMLQQNPETMQKMASRYSTTKSRQVDYTLHLVMPRPEHPAVSTPNQLTQADMDSLSLDVHQLAFSDKYAFAMISANLQSPDSSAALLLTTAGQGAVWYATFPFMTRAAAGYPAEQKLLANLLSYDATGWRKRP
jgi:hypothetical protein